MLDLICKFHDLSALTACPYSSVLRHSAPATNLRKRLSQRVNPSQGLDRMLPNNSDTVMPQKLHPPDAWVTRGHPSCPWVRGRLPPRLITKPFQGQHIASRSVYSEVANPPPLQIHVFGLRAAPRTQRLLAVKGHNPNHCASTLDPTHFIHLCHQWLLWYLKSIV